jgi:hypothetical protein
MADARKFLFSQTEHVVNAIEDPHISLTKPILVRFHEKQVLLQKSREAVSDFSRAQKLAR